MDKGYFAIGTDTATHSLTRLINGREPIMESGAELKCAIEIEHQCKELFNYLKKFIHSFSALVLNLHDFLQSFARNVCFLYFSEFSFPLDFHINFCFLHSNMTIIRFDNVKINLPVVSSTGHLHTLSHLAVTFPTSSPFRYMPDSASTPSCCDFPL